MKERTEIRRTGETGHYYLDCRTSPSCHLECKYREDLCPVILNRAKELGYDVVPQGSECSGQHFKKDNITVYQCISRDDMWWQAQSRDENDKVSDKKFYRKLIEALEQNKPPAFANPEVYF